MITNFVEAIISNKPPISQQVWKRFVPQALRMQILFPSRKAGEKSGKDVDVKQNEVLFLDSSNSQHGGKAGQNQVEQVQQLLPLLLSAG